MKPIRLTDEQRLDCPPGHFELIVLPVRMLRLCRASGHMTPMGEPRRHHSSPVFYLRQWAGEDGQLCEIKKVRDKVEAQRKHPKAAGFERDLYRTDGVPEEHAQHVEKNFMSPLDNDAARALQKILCGDSTAWTGDERTAWTTFILSLLFRNAENVAIIKDHIATMWQEGIKELEANYEARRRPTDPDTFEGYVALTNPAAPQIAASNFLMETISNERVGPTIFNMHWTRHKLTHSKLNLLTSDRPIIMPWGLGDPQAYIVLPVSPSILFMATHDRDFASWVGREKQTELAKQVNKSIVSQARRFVWATDDSQLEFIRRYIARFPDRPIVTEERLAIFRAIRRASSRVSTLVSRSALPPKADIQSSTWDVRFVPKAEVAVIRSVDLIVSSSGRQQGQSLTRRPPGPASSQMMKPISGSTMISKIQSSFSTLDAPLCRMFMSAQISRMRTIIPPIPYPKSITSSSLLIYNCARAFQTSRSLVMFAAIRRISFSVNAWARYPVQFRPHCPQSSSASRFTASAFGFLTLSQCGERPERYGEPIARLHVFRNDTISTPQRAKSLYMVWVWVVATAFVVATFITVKLRGYKEMPRALRDAIAADAIFGALLLLHSFV